MAREDLNPVDEARACAALVEDLGLSKEELARRLGRSRPAISNLIRLLDLPDEVLELLESGELSEGHGRAILQAHGNDARRSLAREAAARRLVGPRDRAPREGLDEPGGAEASSRTRTRRRRSPAPRRRSSRRSAPASASAPPAAGFGAELHFDDLDELHAFARATHRRLARVRAPAARSASPSPARGVDGSGRAGGRPGPARTRSARAARGTRPRTRAAGRHRRRIARPPRRRARRASPRSASGWLCGDAQAPICASRGRLAKYASDVSRGQPLDAARGPAPGGRAPASRGRARRSGVASSWPALAELEVGEEAEAVRAEALQQDHARVRRPVGVHRRQRHRVGERTPRPPPARTTPRTARSGRRPATTGAAAACRGGEASAGQATCQPNHGRMGDPGLEPGTSSLSERRSDRLS